MCSRTAAPTKWFYPVAKIHKYGLRVEQVLFVGARLGPWHVSACQWVGWVKMTRAMKGSHGLPKRVEKDSKKGNSFGALTNIRAVPTMTLRPWPRTQPGHFFEANVNG